MRLLFIKLKHIGDTLLLTPTLDAVRERYPHVEIDVLVRRGTEDILTGCRSINRIYTTVAPEQSKRGEDELRGTLRLIREMRQVRYDFVILASPEDRACLHALAMRTNCRVVNPCYAKGLIQWLTGAFERKAAFDFSHAHSVVRDYELARAVLDLPEEPPTLRFDIDGGIQPRFIKKGERTVILHPASRVREKEWPPTRWMELIEWLLKRFDRVIISQGPSEREVALGRRLAGGYDPRVVTVDGKLTWMELAAHLKAADLFIGVDTAAMHLAAACGCLIVALFGPSKEYAWGPWKAPCAHVLYDRSFHVDESLPFWEHHQEYLKRSISAVSQEQVKLAVKELGFLQSRYLENVVVAH